MPPSAPAPPAQLSAPAHCLREPAITQSHQLGRIAAVVHLGFAVLLVASLVRYVMRHPAADNIWVLTLAAGACASYAVVAVLARRRPPGILWMVALVALWSALVVVAPSFAWCSVAVFFLCRTSLSGWAAHAAGAVIAAATSAGLVRLSGGTDIAMLLGPLAVGAMMTLIYDRIEHDAREQHRLHAQVSAARDRLAASERRAGVVAERERVSREIHDTVTQGLASSLLLLEAATRTWPSTAAQNDVDRATVLLRANLVETRSLVHELASPGLDGVPLAAALRQAASAYVPNIRVQVTGPERPVASEIRHAVLRVVQSAAANIKLHAAAPHSTVTLGYLPGTLTLDIYDDGGGFDLSGVAPPSELGGYGLRAMQARVEQLGGVFSVESTPGEGTIVAAQLPTEENPYD